jgi:hypothetical protein
MSPRRARVRRHGAAAGVAVVLVMGLAGCGSDESAKPEGPSRAALQCREQWNALGGEIADKDERTNPSALAPRWGSISAAVEHYRSAAEGSDCDETLEKEKSAVAKLTSFSSKLARFDMELRLVQVRDEAAKYAQGPRPPAPKAEKGKKGKKQKRAPRPPKPAEVAAALKTLTRQAPAATEQQRPGWQQAEAIDLDDAKAVKKAVKDLDFLSEESKAFRASSSALATIRRALAATQG